MNRSSLAKVDDSFEEALAAQTRADRRARMAVERKVAKRARQRELERDHRHGSVRFVALCLTLVATAAVVIVAMFETLYYVMG